MWHLLAKFEAPALVEPLPLVLVEDNRVRVAPSIARIKRRRIEEVERRRRRHHLDGVAVSLELLVKLRHLHCGNGAGNAKQDISHVLSPRRDAPPVPAAAPPGRAG